MTCKDCLYYAVCEGKNQPDYMTAHGDECKFFRNKADYAEVKHGYWKADKRSVDVTYICSECKSLYSYADPEEECDYNYCPNCGAKMDLKEGAE